MTAADRADLRAELAAQHLQAEADAAAHARAACVTAARRSPHWPFGVLTPMQQRARAAQEARMRADAVRRAPEALW